MKTKTNVIHPKALLEIRKFFRSEFHDMVSVIDTYATLMTDEEKATLAGIDNMGDFFDAFDVFIDGLNDWSEAFPESTAEVTA